jgi:aspartate aminotransferase-like enzyme
MTTIKIDNANLIRKILKNKYNVHVAGGQDHLNDKIIRINHMGLVEDFEMSWAINSIEKTLEELNIRDFSSTANKVFMDSFFK